jgi:SpoVK/Ycf46/Vps4 family AAA+-type ATPase
MNLFDLIIQDKEQIDLADVFLDAENRKQIEQLIREHQFVDELVKYQLPVNNKILLFGSSGCGKTMTAKALAKSLGKPIIILNLSNVVASRIGETSQNLKQVFDKAIREKAVLFLDEFDQIGKERDSDEKDVGEMRRIVNSIIQMMDYLPKTVVLVCATNNVELIDTALLRRFQLKLNYTNPSAEVLDDYYTQLLEKYPEDLRQVERKYDFSFAEAKDYILTSVKELLLRKLEQQA